QRSRVARRNDEPGLLVDDEVAQPSDARRDDGSSVRHRLQTRDAEPFTTGRTGDDRGPRVEVLELVVRYKASRPRNPCEERPVAGDDEVHPACSLDELEYTLLR